MQTRLVLVWLACFLSGLALRAAGQEAQPELVLQTGHAAPIKVIALHPDGKHVVTGANDGRAILWDIASGRQLRTYRGGPLGNGYEAQAGLIEMKLPKDFPMSSTVIPTVHALQFSRDGRRLMVICIPNDLADMMMACGTATVWETATGRLICRMELGQEFGTAMLSPDGQRVIVGGFPLPLEEVKEMSAMGLKIDPVTAGALWDVASGRKLCEFGGFETEIMSGQFTPDGRHIVVLCAADDVASRQQRGPGAASKAKLPEKRPTFVSVWEVPLAKQVRRFSTSDGMNRLELSPRGDRFLLKRDDNAQHPVEVWDLTTEKRLCFVQSKMAVLARDGRQLVTVDDKGRIQIRDLPEGKQTRTLAQQVPDASALAAAPDGTRLVVGTSHQPPAPGTQRVKQPYAPGEVVVCDLAKGEVRTTAAAHHDSAEFLAVSSTGRYLLIGDSLWDTRLGTRAAAVCKEPVHRFAAAFSADEQRLAISNHQAASFFDFSGLFGSFGSRDATVAARMIEFPSGRELQQFKTKDEIKGQVPVRFNADGSRLLTVARRGIVTAWDAAKGEKIKETRIEGGFVVVATSPDGKLAAAFYIADSPVWWDLRSGEEVSAQGHKAGLAAAEGRPRGTSRDGKRRLDIAGDGLTVTLMDSERPTAQRTLKPKLQKSEHISGVDFDAENEQFACTTVSRPVSRLWDPVTGKEVRDLEWLDMPSLEVAAFSPDGRQIAAGGTDGRVTVWNVETGKLAAQLAHSGPVMSLGFSGDGQRLVAGCGDRTAVITRLDNKATTVFRGHEGAVAAAALAADDKFLVTVSREDGTARVWDAAGGKQLARLISLNDRNDWLVITPDGRFDGSEAALRAIMYRVGNAEELVPGDKIAPPRHRPGLLGKLWRGETP